MRGVGYVGWERLPVELLHSCGKMQGRERMAAAARVGHSSTSEGIAVGLGHCLSQGKAFGRDASTWEGEACLWQQQRACERAG